MVLDVISYQKARKHGHRHSADRTDAIPERGLARTQLEYPLEDVSFAWLAAVKMCKVSNIFSTTQAVVLCDKILADKSIKSFASLQYVVIAARFIDYENFYYARQNEDEGTRDVQICKNIDGTKSLIGYEAVDINASDYYLYRLSCSGSELKLYRIDMTTSKISITDTDISEGYFGYASNSCWLLKLDSSATWLEASSSLIPSTLGYFSAPIIGTGTDKDSFRIITAEERYDHPKFGTVNKLSLSNSALIKTDTSGKPIDGEAIVRVFKQNERADYLRDEASCINEFKKIQGVKELSRDEAIKQAKAKDDKLHDLDLMGARELRKSVDIAKREYISWREKTLGLKRENIDDKAMRRHVQEKKW